MILLLGASGYIGQAFARELQRRKLPFTPLSRKEVDYTRFDALWNFLKAKKPEFVINAAGYTGKPNVDACELARADTLAGNALLPQTIAHACAAAQIPWGHVSSGCIFTGAKVTVNGQTRAEKDLMRPDLHELVDKTPLAIHGFTETDAPNFSFRDPPCSFYSGTKALGEEAIAGIGQSYLWRLRIPFDEFDSARNYLSKLQRYPKVYDNVNSISHRGGFCAGVPGFVGAPRAVRHLQRDQSGFRHDAAGDCLDSKNPQAGEAIRILGERRGILPPRRQNAALELRDGRFQVIVRWCKDSPG